MATVSVESQLLLLPLPAPPVAHNTQTRKWRNMTYRKYGPCNGMSFSSVPPIPGSIAEGDTPPSVFLSTTGVDLEAAATFVQCLTASGAHCWHYLLSSRETATSLYRELELRIQSANGFIVLLTDSWRKSTWTEREYQYASEIDSDILVVQLMPLAKPVPLLLNHHPRIDLSHNPEEGWPLLEQWLQNLGRSHGPELSS